MRTSPTKRQALAELCQRTDAARWLKEARGGSLNRHRQQEAEAIQVLAEWRDSVTPEVVSALLADIEELERLVGRKGQTVMEL